MRNVTRGRDVATLHIKPQRFNHDWLVEVAAPAGTQAAAMWDTATQQMGVGFDLLSQSEEQGLVLHSFQVQVGVRVQYLQAFEQLIIKPLDETHQVAPYLQTCVIRHCTITISGVL